MLAYLLDTSSIRSMQYDELRIITEKAALLVSPVTLYEFFCHIDEHDKRDNTVPSHLYRANLQKCFLLKILDDPYVEKGEKLGFKYFVNPNRYEEREFLSYLLPQILQAYEKAATFKEFCNWKVTYLHGEVATIRDVATRSRSTLENDEEKYVRGIQDFCSLILKDYDYQLQKIEAQLTDIIVQCALNIARKCNCPVGLTLSSMFPYFGYQVVRTIKYLGKASVNIKNLNIDRNDMEDCFLCLHLALDQERVLVTGDTGIQKGLSLSLDSFRNTSKAKQISLPTVYAEVINTEEFKDRLNKPKRI